MMGAVYRKEMRSYLRSLSGYSAMGILLLFMGLFVSLFNLLSGYADLSYALTAMQWVLIVLFPLLTLRPTVGERLGGTDLWLSSLPLSLSNIVLGKYFAMVTVFFLPTAVSCLYPLILSSFGNVSLPAAYTALFGYFLLGAALMAISMFISSLFESRILAAVVGISTLFVVYFLGALSVLIPAAPIVSFLVLLVVELAAAAVLYAVSKNPKLAIAAALVLVLPTVAVYLIDASLFSSLVPRALLKLDLFSQFAGFGYGHFDIPCTVLYLTVIAFFVFCTVQTMNKRRHL